MTERDIDVTGDGLVYVLTDADGEPIAGERYYDSEAAIDARVRLMDEHEDGDEVTVEVRDA